MKRLSLVLITALIIIFTCVTAVSAETDPVYNYEDPTYAIESFPQDVTEEIPEYTVATEVYTTDVTDPTEEIVETEPEGTYEAPAYLESLPEVNSTEVVIPSAVGESIDENEPKLFWGFVAWICIGVGAAVILAVLLTTKTKAYRSGGRNRYSTGDKLSGKKRLLNDKYYSNRR